MKTYRIALLFSFAGRYGELVISLLTAPILARLLTPAEIGVYAVGAALATLVRSISEFGIENYIAQVPRLRKLDYRTAFGLTLGLSLLVGSALLILHVPIAALYGEPALEVVIVILAMTFFIVPFNLPILALLRREMRFDILCFVGTLGALVYSISSVLFAANGFGATSMAWAVLLQTSVVTIVALYNRGTTSLTWPSLRAWRRVSAFGVKATTIANVYFVGALAPELIIGRALGFDAAGVLSRSQSVAQIFDKLITNAIRPVALPALTAHLRTGQSLTQPFLRKVDYLSVIAWPSYGFCALMAAPIVRILLGGQWDAAVPVVQILCLTGVVVPFGMLNAEFFVALDQQGSHLRIELVVLPLKIVSAAIAALHSLEMAALAIILGHVGGAVLTTIALQRRLGYRLRDLLKAFEKGAIVVVTSLALPLVVCTAYNGTADQALLYLTIGAIGAAAGWTFGLFVTGHALPGVIGETYDRQLALWRSKDRARASDDRLYAAVESTPRPRLDVRAGD